MNKRLQKKERDFGPMTDPPYFIIGSLVNIIEASVNWLKARIGLKRK
jgi:hypothetical protein